MAYNGDKGLYSHLGGYGSGGHYPPQGYYPPGGYPQSGYPQHGGYPPQGYPVSSGHGGHGGHAGMGLLAGGAAALGAAAYGAQHLSPGYGSHGYGSHGYGSNGHVSHGYGGYGGYGQHHGSGRFLMWLAKRNPGSKNYMGLEIREKLVTCAKTWAKELALSNIHFMFANAAISFRQLLSTYPGPLMPCPDPHFKNRHHKRRIVQKPLVEAIVDELMPGGQVFIQSDVLEVAIDMRQYFDEESQKLIHVDKIDSNIPCDDAGWLLSNPMGIRTEREIHAEYEGARIYRRMYQKTHNHFLPFNSA
uniref:tRNA (guanine(46)-N(7))-methyltransferase n=1 Tax=Tanacetum cinerariifolium TaxID=118510 RepID=A0A6L2KP94_TANCI|nr:tRNA (guanine-N(7)-)-methyltransferase-like isoform X2 [Tanacetum cinerariifolium]GEW95704.1 tRNA (guanine-N(7)-)-methyltransferase-like isoform X2 [Tanacetum cinerariifolium]